MTETDATSRADAAAGASVSSSVPTMFDVARRAGVSHMTVSRVLNRRSGVAEATRQRVEQAIAELNYAPSPTARAMANRRSGQIGLIQAGRPDYGPSSAALGFNEAARAGGYTVSQVSMRAVDAEPLTQAVHRLVLQRVEAIVVISGEREAVEIFRGIDAGLPIVAVASEEEPGLHRVSMDQYAGAVAATEHLIALGHREIRHVTGPADSMDAAERRRGWADVLRRHGLPASQALPGDWLPGSGYAAGRALLADEQATAVFVGNDQMSLGLLAACREAGVAVPERLSVIGFDDIPEAAFFAPPLTTMRQDFDRLGRDIMAAVLAALDGAPADAVRPALVPELVVRASTAPPHG
ncbi:LacI family DNA-binding transcriptional regulator [Agromyces sp. G08B096]|uniref:LacI family DNA-binding transcriptional regulator n=1 Tax=Agromyces sp. G08B096 TaxID=3156399 RepID=A0AAU7W705_9MICO